MGELNVHNLQEYIDKYGCETFVETGTGKGFGLAYALQFPFKRYYSIEIMKELYYYNLDFFRKIPNKKIMLVNDNSLSGLKLIIRECEDERMLFWLDAHFPGADFQLGTYNDEHPKHIKLPVIDEIKLIMHLRPKNKDVFIIDDLNIYETGDYELGNSALREKLGYPSLEPVYKMMQATHTFNRVFRHQGSMVITPR